MIQEIFSSTPTLIYNQVSNNLESLIRLLLSDEKISKKRKREENVQQSKKKKKAKLMDVHTTAFQNAANENNNDAEVEPKARNDG